MAASEGDRAWQSPHRASGHSHGPHRLGFRQAKGRPPSRWAIFYSSNSMVMVVSPTLAFSRAISSSRTIALAFLDRRQDAIERLFRQGDSRATGSLRVLDKTSFWLSMKQLLNRLKSLLH